MNKLHAYGCKFRVERGHGQSKAIIEGRIILRAESLEEFYALKDSALDECFTIHGYKITDTDVAAEKEVTHE